MKSKRLKVEGSKFIALAVVMFFIVSCAPEKDPRNIADGYATKAQADRLDAQAAYALDQAAIVDEISNIEKKTRLDIFLSVKNHVIVASKWGISLLAVVLIPTVGLYIWKTGQTVTVTTERILFAKALKAEFQATLLWMDEKTRSLPVQIYEVDGAFYLMNHNTGVKALVTGNDVAPNPQQVAAFAQLSTTGILAMEARKGKGNAGSASHFGAIDPTLITMDELSGELVNVEA